MNKSNDRYSSKISFHEKRNIWFNTYEMRIREGDRNGVKLFYDEGGG